MNKLLIVDDYSGTLDTLKFILNSHGYKVKTLRETHNIYKEIDEYKPDLLMLDVFLDAEGICTNLKSNHRYKNLRILLLSAFLSKPEACLSFGADDCIEKPFALNELLEKIRSILEWQLESFR
jgi:DNA-binding response OmpR family regulator